MNRKTRKDFETMIKGLAQYHFNAQARNPLIRNDYHLDAFRYAVMASQFPKPVRWQNTDVIWLYLKSVINRVIKIETERLISMGW